MSNTSTSSVRAKNKLIPELRFPEFAKSAEWEEFSLDSISPAIFDGTHQTPKYTIGGIPFFSVENLISKNKNKFISREDYLLATVKNKPERGDILITRIGNIGFSAVVDWDYEFSIYVTLAVVKKSNKFIPHYLNGYFQSDFYQKEIRSKSLLNAVPMKINMDELRKTKVILPPDKEKKEQKKIASCLSSLDELIAAHNDKLEALKDHKKGLMQNLFPQDGKTVPKVRFPDFECDGEWGEKMLGDAADFINGRAYKKEELLTSGKYRVLRVGNFFTNNEYYYSDLELDEDKYCDNGDLLYAWSASFGPRIWKEEKVIYHYHIWKVIEKKEIDKQFLYVLLDFETENIKAAQARGLGMQHLTKSGIESWESKIPPTKKEQQKIASCLSALDDLIKSQTEKIEQLQQHKKGLMQGLFPKIV